MNIFKGFLEQKSYIEKKAEWYKIQREKRAKIEKFYNARLNTQNKKEKEE